MVIDLPYLYPGTPSLRTAHVRVTQGEGPGLDVSCGAKRVDLALGQIS